MEIFIYQNFRALFYPKIKVKIKIRSNSSPYWVKRLQTDYKNAHSQIKLKQWASIQKWE